MTDSIDPAVHAAGAVLWRPARATRQHGIEVGLVHRPKYDDWSLPKGKVDPGEHILACAVREVLEETGHAVALGAPLGLQHYPVSEGLKRVTYWAARADDSAPAWAGTAEIDRLEFVPTSRVASRLTHPRDAELVAIACDLLGAPPEPTTPLIILRHSKALARKRWHGDDAARPLDPKGVAQSDRLVVLLACFGITRVVSSDSLRCLDTVRPYATAVRTHVELEPRVSEEAHEENPDAAAQAVRELMADPRPTVVCSHRPVLPTLYEALGTLPDSPFETPTIPDDPLGTGSFVVVHRRTHTSPDGPLPVVASERHDP